MMKYENGYYWLRHIKYNSPPEIGHIIYGEVYTTFKNIGNGTKVEEYEILDGPLLYPPKQDVGQ